MCPPRHFLPSPHGHLSIYITRLANTRSMAVALAFICNSSFRLPLHLWPLGISLTSFWPQISIYEDMRYIYTSISRICIWVVFTNWVVCSDGRISRGSSLVNRMVCHGSRTQDIRFCWRSPRRLSTAQGTAAVAAVAQCLEWSRLGQKDSSSSPEAPVPGVGLLVILGSPARSCSSSESSNLVRS